MSQAVEFDRTVTPDLMEQLVAEENLIENYDPESAKGASYDFRVGEKVVVARPDAEEHKVEYLKDQGEVTIKPGNAYTIYSKEKVNMPNDIQGRLSLKFRLAAKKLFFSGGLVDPGYEGHLFFTIFNLSSSNYTFQYGDPVAAGEFRLINETEKPYDRGRMESIPDNMLPRKPDIDHKIRNIEQINALISEHESKLNSEIEKTTNLQANLSEVENRLSDKMDSIDDRMTTILLGGIMSIIAGVTAGLTVMIIQIFV